MIKEVMQTQAWVYLAAGLVNHFYSHLDSFLLSIKEGDPEKSINIRSLIKLARNPSYDDPGWVTGRRGTRQ